MTESEAVEKSKKSKKSRKVSHLKMLFIPDGRPFVIGSVERKSVGSRAFVCE